MESGGKGESKSPKESVLLATSHGIICERWTMSRLKAESELQSQCDSGHKIEKSHGALSLMKGVMRVELKKEQQY